MIDSIDRKKCTGCEACFNICPTKSIDMLRDKEGFLYPSLNNDKCISCGLCLKVCQALEQKVEDNKYCEQEQCIYVCQNKNEYIRGISTSGGFFTVLTDYIIKKQGVVFGAILDDKLMCVHNSSDYTDVYKFCGSKYVQSKIGSTYSKVKDELIKGRKVCFSGTPCQIYGLKKFLGKEYDNLILIDLLCHGVPSPGIYESYKKYLEDRYNSKIDKISFRNKERAGYKHSALKAFFENGKNYTAGIEYDPYLRLFFSDIILRPSCYSCKFRSKNRVGDLTLFDCWHIKLYCESMDDNLGTTSVMINTDKGKEIFEDISINTKLEKVDLEQCLKLDGDMTYRIITEPENRSLFFDDYGKYDFGTVLKKYVPIGFKHRMKKFLKNNLFKRKNS